MHAFGFEGYMVQKPFPNTFWTQGLTPLQINMEPPKKDVHFLEVSPFGGDFGLGSPCWAREVALVPQLVASRGSRRLGRCLSPCLLIPRRSLWIQ